MGISSILLKLRKVNLAGKTLEEFSEEKVKAKSKTHRKNGLAAHNGRYKTWAEALTDYCDEYHWSNQDGTGFLFEKISEEDEYFIMKKLNPNGILEVAIKYHNGGGHWTEFIEKSDLENINWNDVDMSEFVKFVFDQCRLPGNIQLTTEELLEKFKIFKKLKDA